jgi:hypothetical protein
VKKALSFPLLLVGVALVAIGAYSANQAIDGKAQIRDGLTAANVTTPGDASIPNARVDDAATARSMAQWIDGTMAKATDGRNWNQIGHYLTATGTDTDDVAQAAIGPNGQPTVNPLRQVAFEASTGSTSLNTSVLAFKVADLTLIMGAVMALLGLGTVGAGLAMTGLSLATVSRRAHLPHPHLHRA